MEHKYASAFLQIPKSSDYTISYWLANINRQLPAITPEKLIEQHVECKSLIIGAGMTGLSCAYWLSELGVDGTIVLEARDICTGATGRNGGHLWPAVKTPENGVSNEELNEFRKVYAFDLKTMTMMEEYLSKHHISHDSIDFRYTGAVIAARFDTEVEMMKTLYNDTNTYYDDLSRQYNQSLEIWDAEKCKKELHAPSYKGGFYLKRAGQFFPAKFVWSMVDVVKDKVNFMTHNPVESVHKKQNRFHVKTNRGAVIIADNIIYATNAYTSMLREDLKEYIKPVRGQVITTSPIKDVTWKCSISQNDGYEYMIQREDGRVVLGGMRWRSETKEVDTVDDSTIHPNVSAEETFPILKNTKYTIEQEWTGIMGYTPDENPIIGKLDDGSYIAAGFSGHGMPRCFGAAKMIAEMITNQFKSEDEIKAFSLSRFVH